MVFNSVCCCAYYRNFLQELQKIQKIEINWELYDSLINQVILWIKLGDNYLIYEIEINYVTSNCSTSLYVMLTFDTFSDEEMKNPPSIYKSTSIGNEIDKFLSTYHNVGSSQWLSIPFAHG